MDIKRLRELSGIPEAISSDQAKFAHAHDAAHDENAIRDAVTHTETIIDDILENPRKYPAHTSKELGNYEWVLRIEYQPALNGHDITAMINSKPVKLAVLDDLASFQYFIKLLVNNYTHAGWRVDSEFDPSRSNSTAYNLRFSH